MILEGVDTDSYLMLRDGKGNTLHVNMIKLVVREWKSVREAAIRRSSKQTGNPVSEALTNSREPIQYD